MGTVGSVHFQIVPSVQLSSVQWLSRVQLFATPRIAARQASLSITNSRSSLRLPSIESVMPSSHLILILMLEFYLTSKHHFLGCYQLIRMFFLLGKKICISMFYTCFYNCLSIGHVWHLVSNKLEGGKEN